MAVICRDYRLLFIQAPRTGCTAVERLLLEHFGGESLPREDILDSQGFARVGRKHSTIRQLLAEGLIPPDYARHLTTVATVRNPFDSLVSLYVKKRDTYHGERFLQDPNSWVHRVRGFVEDMEYCRTHTFEDWLMKRYAVGRFRALLGRGRRSLYGRYTEGVAVVMRFERLQQDFEMVMHRLGITSNVTIPMVNRTAERAAGYQAYYTPAARQLVAHVFKEELQRYGYSFEGLQRDTPALVEEAG